MFFTIRVISDLEQLKKVNLLVLLLTLAGLLGLLYYPYQNIDQILNKSLQGFATLMLVVYAMILLFFNYTSNKGILKVLLILVVCCELVYLNGKTVRTRDTISQSEWKQKTGYNDYSVEAAAYIKKTDPGFYRVSKDYSSGPAIHGSINDAKVHGYFGTSSYYSFNQKNYIRFLEETDLIKKGEEMQSRWAQGVTNRPLLQILSSVKYHFTRKSNSFYQQTMGYDSIGQFGDVKVLKNKYFLPLGCSYSAYISHSQFAKLSSLQKDFAILKAIVAEEPVSEDFKHLKEITAKDTSTNFTFVELSSMVTSLKKDSLTISHFSNNHIRGSIRLKEPEILFFSIPYDKGWSAVVDGKPTKPVLCNLGFTGIFLTAGEHQVQLDFELPNFGLSLGLSGVGIFIYLILLILLNTNISEHLLKQSSSAHHLVEKENP